MFNYRNHSVYMLLKEKKNFIKKKKNFISSNNKPRVTSPSLTTVNSASNSMISILSRIFAVLTVLALLNLVIIAPLYEIYTYNTIWHSYTWHYKEIFFVFCLCGHLITYFLHKKISKKK